LNASQNPPPTPGESGRGTRQGQPDGIESHDLSAYRGRGATRMQDHWFDTERLSWNGRAPREARWEPHDLMAQPRHIARLAALVVVYLAFVGADCTSAAAKPAGKPWVLERGRDIPSTQLSKPTLRVQGQQLSGSTGCNAFTATLSKRPDKRVAIEQVSQTRKLCGPRESEVEAAFVRALSETEFLKQEGGRLTFLSGSREVLLVWTSTDKSTRSRSARRKSMHVSKKAIRAAHRSERCGCCRW
jgi:heat shock protein HslJ